MKIFIESIKGDYILSEWEDDFEQEYKSIVEMLLNDNFVYVNTELDYLNQYDNYIRGNEKIILTIRCC